MNERHLAMTSKINDLLVLKYLVMACFLEAEVVAINQGKNEVL